MAEKREDEGRVDKVERRVDKLEGRQDSVERRVDRLEGVRRLRRRAPVPGLRAGPRCPGCHLPRDPARKRTCGWCGFVYA